MDASRGIGTFGVWDYVVFAAMLAISAVIGIYYAFAGNSQHTSKEFLTGGRSMNPVPVALSLTASFMSAVTVLGTPTDVYRFGVIFSLFGITYFLVVVISAEVFLPVFYRLGITSTYEYLELRFNKYVRLCGTIFYIVQTVLYTGIVIYAPALALNQVTGLHLWGAVVATGVVCTFYCTLGGLKAVVWTDVFQVGIMLAGFLSVFIRATVVQGGINTILNDAYKGGRLNFWNFDPNPLQRHTFWTIIIGGTFTWTSVYGVNQSQVQRYIACKSRFHAKLTVSSSINALAAVTVEDLVKPNFRSLSERCLSWISQGTSVLFGVLCIGMAALASLMGGVLQAALSIFGIVGGPLLGLFALGILIPFANSTGALTGLLAGFVVSLWVGIGAQLYPPLPERSMPLSLETYGCNSTHNGSNWMTTTEIPFSTSAFQVNNVVRTPLMDNWYSLSYLYFSTLGTLIALFVGMLVSLPTGGRKQNIDGRFLLTKEDILFKFDIFKKKKHVLSYKSHTVEDGGTDNPAFNHIELNLTDQSGKINGTHL
ncbi:Sodium-coupled monocarboxylate transporter 1 [Pteropus alecto]|uniref:Sodium-coupled monocarboxylate transporter 1 n=1 Tax=Pteropus alecto TaxID=9402 RepID=L5KG90_PTEAL|nr:Sodium-coupled monocarboxylate transporter 1 [Pteropus alecto]